MTKFLGGLLFLLFGFSVEGLAHDDYLICGTVFDTETKTPLPNVSIGISSHPFKNHTDPNGKFCIKTHADSLTLRFSLMGYQNKRISISCKNDSSLRVFLRSELLMMNEVVVSANKNAASSLEQTITSQVISNEAILESGAQNIPDLLVKQPSVSLAGQAYHAAPSIRGLARKRVLVMVDGEKTSSERNVGTPGTFINPFEIEQIEILKGPYSTLYGSDAIGGVVNILTKSFETPYYNQNIGGRFDISTRSVSNAKNGNLALNGMLGKWMFHVDAGYRDADDYTLADGTALMNTFYEEKHAGGKLTFMPNDHHAITFKSYYSDGGEIGKPAYDTLTNAVHDKDVHFIAGVNYKWTGISRTLTKAELNFSRHDHDLGVKIIKHKTETDPSDDKLVNNRKTLSSTDYVLQGDFYFTLNKRLKILTGFDSFLHQDIDISESKVVHGYYSGLFLKQEFTTLLSGAYQNSYGVFVQADFIATDKLFTSAGVRWNYISTNGAPNQNAEKTDDAFSANFGLSYILAKSFTLKANVGSAFRAPDVKELYITTNTPGGLNIGNPDLASEHSLNFDLALIYKGAASLVELSAFHNQIENMIVLDWDNSTASREGTFRNIGKGVLYGVELAYKQNLTQAISPYFNFSWIHGYDDSSDDELTDVPPIQINLGIKYKPVQKLLLHLSARYSAEQTEVADDDIPTDAFTVIDFNASVQLLENLALNASVTNLFNEDYREHYQFDWMRAPGRSFNTGLHFNF
ncbi:TonB-dependent receptor [Chloroherpeton thalassium ATCC 35110]|uniref:TonB-dependent receptor n=1 Tax=Chloroherpeton thalassium (strain ATCC 35110 / GB-78) TaxID=517418 RepID=B3QXI2_CHLT3|nr:TonB-dependent receptor [Chloroherpeton thalassium]ACF13456.1 TonB-dependent receptor [Chloroherpeton thalassium ATCC 35110]